MNAGPGVRIGKGSASGCDQKIVVQCDFKTAGNCVPVDCTDDRLAACTKHIGQVQAVSTRIKQVFSEHDIQVEPEAEGLAVAGKNSRPDKIVAGNGVQSVVEANQQRLIDGVASSLPVQCNHCHPVFDGEKDGIGHSYMFSISPTVALPAPAARIS